MLSCDDKRESVTRVKFSDVPLILLVNSTERGKSCCFGRMPLLQHTRLPQLDFTEISRAL
jgi:hypothetical protein